MKGVELTVSDEYAEVMIGEAYDASEQAYAYVADAIPSIDDLRAEFCAEFRRCAPGCEISAVPCNQRHLLVTDGIGEDFQKRHKIYGKARVDMEVVHAGALSKAEHVRGACLLAARKMAATVAVMAMPGSPFVGAGLGGAASIRWTGGGPLHWPGFSTTGRPRVAVEFSRDSIVLLLASYFVLVPAGFAVVESEPQIKVGAWGRP